MISDNATCFKNIWRPITYAYNDEFSEPLTPSHLIYGYGILSTKLTNDRNLSENEQFSTGNLSKHIKYSHNLLETYWNQWTKEYLNELREHHTTRKNVNSIIKLGDIVFIHNHHAKRNVWKLGKVVRLFTSKGQNVRAATRKIHNQNPLYQYINRPVNKVYPLEVASNEPVTQEEVDLIPWNIPSDKNITDYNETSERARRIAADNSILIRRLSEQTQIQEPRKRGVCYESM